MDLNSISQQVHFMPDSQLMSEMHNPNGLIPQYLVLGELSRRAKLRQSAPTQQPQGTVADDVMRSLQGAGMQTTNNLTPGQPPQQQRPMGQGIAAAPQQMPQQQPPQGIAGAAPQPQRMAKGGIVRLAGGTPDDDVSYQDSAPTQQPQPVNPLAALIPDLQSPDYNPPAPYTLQQASDQVRPLYGPGQDYSGLLQGIQNAGSQAPRSMSNADAMRVFGLNMMASKEASPMVSMGQAGLAAMGAQRESQQASLENTLKLTNAQYKIQSEQQDRADLISGKIAQYQELQDKMNLLRYSDSYKAKQDANDLALKKANLVKSYIDAGGSATEAGSMAAYADSMLPQVANDPAAVARYQGLKSFATDAQAADWAALQKKNSIDLQDYKDKEAIRGNVEVGVNRAKLNDTVSILQQNGAGAPTDTYAKNWIVTGETGLQGTGKEKTMINNQAIARASQMLHDNGVDPGLLPSIRANYKANQSELQKLQGSYGQIRSYEQNVEKNLGPLLAAGANVKRTPFELLNKAIVPLEQSMTIGGTKTYTALVTTVADEYAKVLNGFNGQTSDQARLHAAKILNDGISQGNLQEAVNTLRQEMSRRVVAMQEELGAATNRTKMDSLLKYAKTGQYQDGSPAPTPPPGNTNPGLTGLSTDDLYKRLSGGAH